MAIRSNAFGRVTLTKEDAAKFTRQVIYGKPSQAATTSMALGADLNEKFKSGKRIVRTLPKPGK